MKQFYNLLKVIFLLFALQTQAQTIRYVKATTTGTGSSWVDASGNLQAMINASAIGDQVWVAAGTYQPATGESFIMKEGVKIYGGFAGTESLLNLRNWSANVTTLQGNGNSVISNVYTADIPLTRTALLDGFSITGGNTSSSGGAMYNYNASPTLTNLIITNNTAYNGAGVYNAEYSSPILINSVFTNNTASSNGGGIFNAYGGYGTVLNCTFYNNSPQEIYSDAGWLNVHNTILWNGVGAYNYPDLTFPSCLIGTGLSASTVFTDAANGDFSLINNSPGIDGGDNSHWLNSMGAYIGNEIDLAGNPRFSGCSIDIGVFENQSNQGELCFAPDANNILYVDINVTSGLGDGSSWDKAIPQLADALKWAKQEETQWTEANPLKIWVAGGVYKPMYKLATVDLDNNPTTDRDKSFSLVNYVNLYGGFAGTEATLDLRDLSIVTNTTILSGDFNSDDTVTGSGETLSITGNSENAYHVVVGVGGATVLNAELNGFVIEGAHANVNSEIRVNTRNVYRSYGGGLYIDNSSTVLKNVDFSSNKSTYDGGGMYIVSSSSKLMNVTFRRNEAKYGGGIFNTASTVSLTNTLIIDNRATYDGAGMYNRSSSPVLTNVTIAGNSAVNSGGGIYNYLASFPKTYNSIVFGNGISQVYNNDSTSEFHHSLIEGTAWDVNWGPNLNDIVSSVDPFTNAANGDYTLAVNSLAINTGKDEHWTINVGVLDNTATDFVDNLRLSSCSIDMGAYEKQNVPETVAPTAIDQVFCIGENATIADLEVTVGSNVKWYSSDTSTIPLALTDVLTASTYYASQTLNNCESDLREAVAVTIENPLALTVTSPIQYTYGDTAVALTADADLNNTLVWYDVEIGGTGSDTAPIPTTNTAGTQEYWVSQKTANDCESERSKIIVNVSKATLTVTVDANQSKVYGDVDPVLDYTVSGYENGDTDTILSGALGRVAGEDIDMYAINLGSLSAGSNYDITFIGADFEITKATLTVTVDANQSKVYGDIDPVFNYTVSGYANGDTAIILTGLLSRDSGENVGIYTINQGSLTVNDNYDLTFVGADFEITKATLTVTVDANQTKVYGETDPVFGYTVSGYVNGDTDTILTGLLSRDAGENVGLYAINQNTLSAGDNYYITFVGADFEITKVTLIVTVDANQSKVYGETDPIFGYTVSGYANGDTATVLTGVLGRIAGEGVGTYAINQNTLIAGVNYDITFVGADFKITKAILTVTVTPEQSKAYGDADPVFDYTVSGYANGDTAIILTGLLSRDTGENVGIYTINQGSLTVNDNYDLTFVDSDFEITKAILTVTVDANQSKVYGDADPVFGYTVSGYANGDTSTVLIGVLSRVAGEDVGTYEINQNTLSAGVNYDITFVGDDFTITKATIQGVNLNDATFGYDGTIKSLVINGTLPAGTSVTYQNNSHTNIGVYSVTATISGGNNYFDLVLSADLTIEKGIITGVYLSNGIFTYDGTVKSLVINGVLPAGTSVTYVNNDHINAGVYVVTAVIDGGGNYNDLTLNANLTIKKALITGILFNDAVFTYDGTPKSIAIQGTLPSDAGVSYQNNNQIDVGIYTVTANINGGSNYQNFTLTARLTIEKASQTLDFNVDSPVVLEDVQDYQLEGSASSGLDVSYTYSYNSITPAAEVSETGWLEFKHPGEIEITAYQEGNHNYHAATAVTKTLIVESRDATIHELWIDQEHFEKPSDEIIYTMDCNSLQNEVSVHIQTQLGATVDAGHEFVISVPYAGIYREIVKVTSQNGKVVKEYVVRIEKPFMFSYIAEQKYDNVLLINNNPKTNGGYKFVKFEWYKNGELIGSEQVYSVGNRSTDLLDQTALYHAVLTTDSGDVLYVCPTEITLIHQYNIKLYPSPAKAGNSVTIKITYPLDQLRGERLDIFDMNGKRITSTTISTEDTELVLPSSLQTGTYIATFKLNGQHKVIHFIVE